MPEISASKYLGNCGWDDVPHLSEKTKRDMLASSEPHLREARSKGTPSLGIGAVYQIAESEFVVDPFRIPDYWPKGYGLDVGWNRTAAVWGAHDRETDTIYLTSEHYRGQAEPSTHATAIKARGEWIPGNIDPAANGRQQSDGEQLMASYQALGLKIVAADNAVEAGIFDVGERLQTGRLKVFRTLPSWLTEYRIYRRDKNGKIVKKVDHLMDACFTADTEVLTSEGWVVWPDATAQMQFGTMNMETRELEFQSPSEMVAIPWNGEIVALRNKTALKVTPNHRMVVIPRSNRTSGPVIKRADELSIWDKVVTAPKGWKGRDTLGLPFDCDDEVLAEMIGWWVAEGSLRSLTPASPFQRDVIISQVKEAGVKDLGHLLVMTPWRWSRRGNDFVTTNKALYLYLEPIKGSANKRVPQCIQDASPRLIEAFLRGYIAGDGWVQNGVRAAATISKRLADDLQILFLKTGRATSQYRKKAVPYSIEGRTGTNTQDQFWVLEHSTTTATLRDSKNNPNFGREHYEGMVYCAQVPNGTLIVRRDGRVSVTGNTRYLLRPSSVARMIVKPVDAMLFTKQQPNLYR